VSVDTRLAVYGTLAPGRENHGQLAPLKGHWRAGTVKGRLVCEGWAAELGYPAIVLDPAAEPVAVQIFESAELPQHWERLDYFEGPAYRRVVVQVETESGAVNAWIYESTGPKPL
jgi:gamma-glutamylcyclotransferase (GGCT)/AIG2-like uncharacterized protein YtfP